MVDVKISRRTGGAYAEPREVIEDELAEMRRQGGEVAIAAEHERLCNMVVVAAKAETAVFLAPLRNVNQWTNELSAAQMALRQAVVALVRFEREHGVGQ